MPQALLRERLAACCAFVQMREGAERPAHPPAWCVGAVHVRGAWPGMRALEAVVDHPVLRPDGTVLYAPGYDPDTALIVETGCLLPPLSGRPGHPDALRARDELLEVVHDFPFSGHEHRAAWLAALLTPLARFAFEGPAPLFLADANVPGAGKGLLFHAAARILRGADFTVAAYTLDESELRKRIFALALGGERLVLLDKLPGPFGGAVLDAALTASAWTDRVLGISRMASVPLLMTWYATGNNVAVAGDTARRIALIRLESDQERPEERGNFRHPNLLRWIGDNRGRLLAAALTILRAYCLAGRPDMGLPAWGTFEGRSGLVRSAVAWVGMPDPGRTRMLVRERADTLSEGIGALLACWDRMDIDRRGLTASAVISRLYPGMQEACRHRSGQTHFRPRFFCAFFRLKSHLVVLFWLSN